MDVGEIWFVSCLGWLKRKTIGFYKIPIFIPHYDIMMGQNRVKKVFLAVEDAFLDGCWRNSVCELVGGG